MTCLTLTAYAKINLTLDVLSRRPDGFHDIHSIMQTISLHDTLEIVPAPDRPGVHLEICGEEAGGVPADESNLVHKAAVRLQKIAAARGMVQGNRSGLCITLTKRIPSQAGLGGGSSDAAAALRGIDCLFGLGLSLERLTELAASLGADIPFFLHGGTARVEGLGDRVVPLSPWADSSWGVVVKPPVGVSTAQAYAALDAIPSRVSAHATNDWGKTRLARFSNDFQESVLAAYPEIAIAYNAMQSEPGYGPLLCGSGAAIFSLLPTEEAANRLADHVQGARVGRVWVTRIQGRTE